MTHRETLRDPNGFHPEIRQIEHKIIDFFAERTVEYDRRDPIVATVMAYFYVRSNLTQRDLQNLTGFSAGIISKSVRQLSDMTFVTKGIIPGTHMHIYKMEQLPFRSPRFFLKTEDFLERLREELKEMKLTLDTDAEEMQDLKEYQNVYTIITQLLELMSSVPMFIALIEEELQKSIEKDNPMR
jgi:DNA-binding transcriptional regulator GbsR (MarR family)